MKEYFVIEFGGEKEINEMEALELDNINEAIKWIKGSMESDEEYYNINIDCEIQLMHYTQFGTELDFYAQAFVSVEYDDILNQEMKNSDIYSVQDIIESNLSIVSKITTRMVER